MGRLHTFVVTLRRDSREVNWGLRLVGGSDLATPLIVTRVTPGTPAGKELVRGDIIAKIDDYDARDLRHEDAQNLFRNAPKQIKLVVQRGGASAHLYSLPRSPGSFVGRVPTPTFYHEFAEDVDRDGPRSTTPMAPRSPIPMAAAAPYRTPSPQPGWRGPESLPRTPVPPHGPAGPAGLPHYSYPLQLEGEYRTLMLSPSSTRTDDTLDESIQSQPYRTTPLVLPGAKVRREPGPTESYLRHHPNPAMRAPPSHDYRDTLMRQKVVHKQFNSPINLYSEQNIANSIRQQTSPLPHKPTVQYDPARSETFRALQEDGITGDLHEVPTPVTPKVFTAPANKKPVPRPIKPEEKPKGKQTTFVNSLHEEHIQQSNSFKRLMYNVLGDTEF
ncbi:LIM domain-binding protein 3 isoform X6 [Spodoptera frugiperda]|uniref:LIM domain-binding protein 3 isoform X6 n=1 Tax=Spodoptera frugiperda TaxID=7108 RepID=A0A9R0ESC0_SPOFR|nr:LIM domain-binding protein 3 isoform X6 [Spodoptera frugiperda]